MLNKLRILLCLMLCLPFLSAQAAEYQAGTHYVELPNPVSTRNADKVEVVAVFSYLCPHCSNLEPALQSWSKHLADDVDYQHLPVVFRRDWEPLARAYYVAELAGRLDATHQQTFDAIHLHQRRLASVDDLAAFYAPLGIDQEEFKKLYGSFAVDMKLKQGSAKTRGYEITGVPAMVVNGKYRITAQMAGGNREMLEVVNYLIEKERVQ